MSRRIETLATWTAAALLAVVPAAVSGAPGQAAAGTPFPGVGRAATPAEIKAWDIDVRPDFKGLPPGSGSVAEGQKIWDAKCAACHGTFGESNETFTPLVGGTTAQDIEAGRVKSLVTGDTARTTLMKVATLSTLWDYINRAMPWNAPKSLTHDEVYASLAYLLNLGDIVAADFVLSDKNIAEAQRKLPNRNGMVRSHGLWEVKGKPDVMNVACMKNCPTTGALSSQLPEEAKDSHGDLAAQQRLVGPAVSVDMADFARRRGCLGCHGVDQRVVGPAFREVADRYRGDARAEAKLLEKVKHGGSATWGPIAMPPNLDLSDEDARTLIRWILVGAR